MIKKSFLEIFQNRNSQEKFKYNQAKKIPLKKPYKGKKKYVKYIKNILPYM